MTELALHRWLTWGLFGLGVVTFVALLRVPAPYGRHARPGWGPTLSARVGWVVMEAPASLLFAAIYAAGEHRAAPGSLALLALWQLHYVHRAFIYPRRMRSGRRMPVAVAAMGAAFQCLNVYLNARWVSHLGHYDASWLGGGVMLVGSALFLLGWLTNLHADAVLRRLRGTGAEGGYRIPRGGLYRWVSCPNYLGELVEWVGWALATASLAGASFAFYTACNLLPRALAHHRWYREHFDDYPPERRAVIPYVV